MSANAIRIGYVNIEVRDLDAAVAFFRDVVGLPLANVHKEFGYAAFELTGGASLGLLKDDAAPGKRHTGIGFMVDDLDFAYKHMKNAGAVFKQPPTKEDWGGYMALFEDLEGNVFYLDQTQPPEEAAAAEGVEFSFEVDTQLTAGTIKSD